jgi:hypothetical protein
MGLMLGVRPQISKRLTRSYYNGEMLSVPTWYLSHGIISITSSWDALFM